MKDNLRDEAGHPYFKDLFYPPMKVAPKEAKASSFACHQATLRFNLCMECCSANQIRPGVSNPALRGPVSVSL